MDEFCGSEFWNSTLSWDTSDPDLTPCFEQTVLVWIPCAYLWVFLILEVYYLKDSVYRNVPWHFLNVTKLFLIAVLIVLTAADIGYASANSGEQGPEGEQIIYPVHYWTPVIKLVTFVLAGVLTYLNKVRGQQTSGLLFVFWFLLVLLTIPQFRTEVRAMDDEEVLEYLEAWNSYRFISFVIFFCCSAVIFLLCCWADPEPKDSLIEREAKPVPELNASFLSRILFAWFDPLAWRGFRRPLVQDDLWDMKHEDASRGAATKFFKFWNRKLEKSSASFAKQDSSSAFKKDPNSVNFTAPKKKKKNVSVMMPLIRAFGGTFAFGAALYLITVILTFVNPQILSWIINFVGQQQNPEPMWKGITYAVLLFVVAAFQTIVTGQYFNRMFYVGLRVRTALISAIYRKSLTIANSARKETTVGEIVNLMAVDAQRFLDLTAYINMLWAAPLQIALALYFLWQILGPSVLAGLAVMIVLIPINGVIANKIKALQIAQMKNKDDRVKLMSEVLNGIKVLKLYAWEPSFEEQVLRIRDKEIKVLKKAAYLNAGTSFIWTCAPFLVSLVTFATFVLVDENNVLDAQIAFVSLSLFNILRFPLSMLPMLIFSLVQTSVSVKRINKFMNAEELNPDNVSNDSSEKAPLVIENGNFSWDGETSTLKNINIRVEENQLVAVVGTVGCGKSSLISAFIGEMDKISGRVNRRGDIAYVPQQAWIQNATLQNNILFGKPYDQKRYERVVEACALKPDLAMLPAGDQTEIGEKGINLSGGQKQRVSLARAVYQDTDIYLLDDPLSAVDSHVGKHIFEQVIGPQGLLAHKTRVLVTHGITYLPQVDNIFVMKGGEISESGSYQQLLDRKGSFAEFLIQHLQEAVEADEDLDELKQQIGDEDLRQKLERAISTSRSRSDSQSEPESVKDSFSRQNSEIDGSRSSLRKRHSTTSNKISKNGKLATQEKGEKLIEAEKSETGGVKWAVYKHYLKSIGITLSVATIILNIIFQGFSIGSNIWLSDWSEDEKAGTNPNVRNMYLAGYGLFGVGQVITTFISSLTMALGCIYASIEMHNVMLNYVMRWPMESFDTQPMGRIMNRFSKDVDAVDNVIPFMIRMLVMMFFSVIATLTVICISTPIFAAVIIPVGALYYFIQRFYVATSRQLKRLESVSRSPIYSHFGETITGVQTIRAYGVQNRFIIESDNRVDYNQVSSFPSNIANRWLGVRLEMVGNLIILFAALFAVLGRDSDISPGLVGLSVSYALQITQTLNWLVRMTSDVETNIVAVERIKEYGETKQEAPWEIPGVNVSRDWPAQGRVEFHDFAVRYREGLDLVLKGITFNVNGGEKVGIVGRTGAGKSSLTLSLFRIIEAAAGQIVIDGEEISRLGLHTLRGRLTIIPQDPVLFSGTLRMNLDPFERYSDDEVWQSLEHAHLKTFVKGLPAGINHEVNEGGENLSVGQRQLICLARALLRKTKVLILDEATAAVDLETDDLIQRTIRTEFKECTVLTIAHRLNTILDSDRVIVLENGQIIEYAPPNSLMQNKSSAFYSMAKDAGLA